MVKPLTFKGDKKPKKRKRAAAADANEPSTTTTATTTTSATTAEDGSAAAGGGGDPREKRLAAATAAEEEDPENDDTWVSADGIGDVVGPVMFVLPTEPPTCLACDMNGKVFTDNVVNIVDGNPASAEPHDVRQVWVANKIAGTEKFRFKGRYGK